MNDDRVHEKRLVIGDAFGEILKACQAAGGEFGVAYELIERSDGHLAATDAARYFLGAPDWIASHPIEGRVLDIGAGAGRVALSLQDRGHDVVALDVSTGATAVCAERGVTQTFTGTVFDLAATRPPPFDTFVMAGNNLGLLGGPDQAPAVLEALASIAAPGARIVGETVDPYQTDNPDHLSYQELNQRLGRFPGQLRCGSGTNCSSPPGGTTCSARQRSWRR